LTISVPPFGSFRIYFGTLIPAQSKRIGLTAKGSYPVKTSLGKGAEHLGRTFRCVPFLPVMAVVTDIYSVSAKNLPLQNCRYLQRIGTFEILKKL
jgi:hypothetical protein